jgi:hypothetical protein
MGLTIQYAIQAPADWPKATIRAKLKEARQFAKDLPVVEVSELTEFQGPDADFQHVRETGLEKEDRFFWAKIQARRTLVNPWQPGTSGSQAPSRIMVFSVDPADGCEEMNVGICSYPGHVWKASRSGNSAPAWSMVFDKKTRYHESREIMREFMRRWNLKKMPSSRWGSGSTEGLGHHSAHGLASAVIARGRYLSHRRGYSASFGMVTIQDRAKEQIRFKYQGSVEQARKVFASPAFRADLERMVYGEDHVTPPASGRWESFTKTQYANDPRCGGWTNFVKAHLSVLAILEKMQGLGFQVEVTDEGGFWEKRDLASLAKSLGEYDAIVAAGTGALKDIAGQRGESVESAMIGRPDFEHLEAKGQKSLGTMLGMLAEALSKKHPPDTHHA